MNSSKRAVGSAAETVWDFYPSGMWALLNRNVYIIQYCGKKYFKAKWAKCATAVTREEKAINSFEGSQVNFFLPVFSMVDDVLLLK